MGRNLHFHSRESEYFAYLNSSRCRSILLSLKAPCWPFRVRKVTGTETTAEGLLLPVGAAFSF